MIQTILQSTRPNKITVPGIMIETLNDIIVDSISNTINYGPKNGWTIVLHE